MKRTKLDYDNTIDGNQLKKIKKLRFLLAEDETEEIKHPNEVVRISNPDSVMNSNDDKSDVSDCESEDFTCNDEDCEKISEEDLATLNKFSNPDIAKDVLEGLKDAKEEVALNVGSDETDGIDWDSIEKDLDSLKNLMMTYKKGRKFPKFIKVLPQIEKWEYILDKLEFSSWKPAAVQYMTEVVKARGGTAVEIYYQHFLLPCLRANVAENKRLDNTLYKTLQGALFRRREFMANILLPWCHENLTGKEAEILGNVLKSSTVKVDVAAPVMMVLMTEMTFSKERLLVLRALLEKKYNLAYQTISAFVDYFYRAAQEDYSPFYGDNGRMPVVWHQTLHLFTSLYYPHLNKESTNKMFRLCEVHFHDKISETITAYLKLAPNTEDVMMDE